MKKSDDFSLINVGNTSYFRALSGIGGIPEDFGEI